MMRSDTRKCGPLRSHWQGRHARSAPEMANILACFKLGRPRTPESTRDRRRSPHVTGVPSSGRSTLASNVVDSCLYTDARVSAPHDAAVRVVQDPPLW